MRQPHVPWQRGIGGFVRQIVANVREERPLRFQPLNNRKRILHRRVRGMRLVPQRVQKQNVQPSQLIASTIPESRCGRSDTPPSRNGSRKSGFAMNHGHRFEAHAKHIYRPVNRLQFQLRQPAKLVVCVKDVAEHSAQKRRRIGTRVERQVYPACAGSSAAAGRRCPRMWSACVCV